MQLTALLLKLTGSEEGAGEVNAKLVALARDQDGSDFHAVRLEHVLRGENVLSVEIHFRQCVESEGAVVAVSSCS